ncbi:uncharacterized protein LOC143247746 [Tachypleus tridentatus]|uniref:uncharacterized protein LOC143247746 n=1 Tax=Tachypleus tridentatus TaxID=6853 RepID=UPI003FD12474
MIKVYLLLALIYITCFVANGQDKTLGHRAIDLSLTDKDVGKPAFAFFGSKGKEPGTFKGGLGVGTKVWESKDGRVSVGVGGTVEQEVRPLVAGNSSMGNLTLELELELKLN